MTGRVARNSQWEPVWGSGGQWGFGGGGPSTENFALFGKNNLISGLF